MRRGDAKAPPSGYRGADHDQYGCVNTVALGWRGSVSGWIMARYHTRPCWRYVIYLKARRQQQARLNLES